MVTRKALIFRTVYICCRTENDMLYRSCSKILHQQNEGGETKQIVTPALGDRYMILPHLVCWKCFTLSEDYMVIGESKHNTYINCTYYG